jgi:hypothetical protein
LESTLAAGEKLLDAAESFLLDLHETWEEARSILVAEWRALLPFFRATQPISFGEEPTMANEGVPRIAPMIL